MHLVPFPLKLVRFALHFQLVLEELLCNRALARGRILQHAPNETILVEVALLDVLEVEVLLRQVVVRLHLVLGHVVHPRQLHHLLVGLHRLLVLGRGAQDAAYPLVGLHGVAPVVALFGHVTQQVEHFPGFDDHVHVEVEASKHLIGEEEQVFVD